MKRFKLKLLNNRGDTIVEVLIVLAILGFAFGTSTGIATRSLHQSRTAEEHSQALGLLNTQLEQLRSAATTGADVFQNGKPFCMKTDNTPDYGFAGSYVIPTDQNADDFTKYADPACKGIDTFYNQSIVYDSASGDYTIRVRWDGVGTLGRQQEITSYRVYKLTTTVAASLATVTECSDGNDNDGDHNIDIADPGCHADGNASNPASYNALDGDEADPACMDTKENDVPTDNHIDIADPGCHSDANPGNPASYTPTRTTEANAVCSNGADDDGDGRRDLADPGCNGNPAGTTEVGSPSPAVISPGRFDSPALHLFTVGGSRQNQTFTITNPASSDSSLTITSTTITPNMNNFQITSSGSGCAGRVLARGASCTVNVQFSPPTGGANNSLGNAGFKTATLNINNSSGVASTPATLTGWAVSDRMAPGDRMYITGDDNDNAARGLRAYNSGCYNDAFSCGNLLVMWANGNLVEYTDAPSGAVAFATGPTSATQMIMQSSDGNLVAYDSVGNPIFARTPTAAGAWLMLFSDSQLWRMQPSYDVPNYSAGYDRVWP